MICSLHFDLVHPENQLIRLTGSEESKIGGPMAHILHAGGPWKLESLCRSQKTGVNMRLGRLIKCREAGGDPKSLGLKVME